MPLEEGLCLHHFLCHASWMKLIKMCCSPPCVQCFSRKIPRHLHYLHYLHQIRECRLLLDIREPSESAFFVHFSMISRLCGRIDNTIEIIAKPVPGYPGIHTLLNQAIVEQENSKKTIRSLDMPGVIGTITASLLEQSNILFQHCKTLVNHSVHNKEGQ